MFRQRLQNVQTAVAHLALTCNQLTAPGGTYRTASCPLSHGLCSQCPAALVSRGQSWNAACAADWQTSTTACTTSSNAVCRSLGRQHRLSRLTDGVLHYNTLRKFITRTSSPALSMNRRRGTDCWCTDTFAFFPGIARMRTAIPGFPGMKKTPPRMNSLVKCTLYITKHESDNSSVGTFCNADNTFIVVSLTSLTTEWLQTCYTYH